jgi:hypothetical protein
VRAVLLAPLALAATALGAPTYYGGGAIVDRAPRQDDYAVFVQNTGVGLARSADGATLKARISFGILCGAYRDGGHRATDAVVSGAVNPDGTFHVVKTAKTQEMGSVKVTLDGAFQADRADGTVALKTHWSCGGQVRPWSARRVDANAAPAPAAPAPADGVLYGLVGQVDDGAPHGLVAKVEDGGTKMHVWDSYSLECQGKAKKEGRYDFLETYQNLYGEKPIAGGAWGYALSRHESAAQRRKHYTFARKFTMKGAFAGTALSGTLSDTTTYAYKKPDPDPDTGRCSTGGTLKFVALP